MAKESVGIGIIGTGFARSTQIPGFRACPGARINAIASGHRENAEQAARDFGIGFATDDWREVIDREDVDLISIVTPPDTHEEMARAALEAGKAVLCEKPTAMNAEEAGRMLDYARRAGALSLIDHELRFIPARRALRDRLRAGEIGRVNHVKYFFRAESRVNPTRPWNWWSDAARGGGVLGALGSHAVDSLRWLLGTEISHVFGQLSTHIAKRTDAETGHERSVTADDEANLILRFRDGEITEGTTGTVSLSVVEQGRPLHYLEVFGSEGAMAIDGNKLLRAGTGDGRWSEVRTESGELAEGMSDNEWSRGFTLFSCAVVNALREGRNTVGEAATFEDGYRNQIVLDLARRSSASGRMEEVEESMD